EEAPAEETEEAPAEETEEEPSEEPAEDVVEEVAQAATSQLVDGGRYIFVIDGSSAIANIDGTIKAVSYTGDNTDPTIIWSATSGSKGVALSNGDIWMYYDSSSVVSRTDGTKGNWGYGENNLWYDGKTGPAYVTGVSGETISFGASSGNGNITLVTAGADEPEDADTYKTASGFVDGQTYVIAVDNGSGLTVLTNGVGSASIAAAKDADESMLWLAVANENGDIALHNGSVNLYYKNGYTNAALKYNWKYDGQLWYQAGGDTYYLVLSDSGVSFDKSAGSTITLYTEGETGSGSAGGDSGDSGDDAGDSASDGFSAWKGPFKDVADETQIAIALGGKTIQFGKGSVGTADAVISGTGGDSTMTIDGNYVILKAHSSGTGYAFYLNDPPGSIDYLYIDGNGNVTHTGKDGTEPTGYWSVNEGGGPTTTTFTYTDGGITWYLTLDDNGNIVGTQDSNAAMKGDVYSGTASNDNGGGGGSETADAEAPVFSVQPASLHYVLVGSDYAAPEYTVTAVLPEGVSANNIYFQWYVNGEAYGDQVKVPVSADGCTSTVTIPELRGQKAGVYPVYCTATCNVRDENGEPVAHTATSYTTNFIVCTGVKPNTILTFSDVHETWNNVGQAIYDTIIAENGLIPSLVIATGDYNNDYVAGYGEDLISSCIDTMIFRIGLQLGGIDTVWVSGNHDNGYATAFTNANINAGFGVVKEDYIDIENGISGTGIIYDSRNAVNADSSAENDGLIVIGVNYEDAGSQGAYSNPSTGRPTDASKLDYGAEGSTGTVYEHLKKALDSAANGYNGELVVISTHSGLHTVGVDADSAACGAEAWSGGIDYSITNSAAIVALINSYVENYNMDIVFLFGHDHSKGEGEFLKLPGDTITSTVSYADQTTEDIVLLFTYGHAGYITNTIGGKTNYSYITYDDETIDRTMNMADGSHATVEALSAVIARLEHPEIIEGMNSEWTIDSDEDLSFRSDAAFDDFLRVEVDGEVVDPSNYTVSEGSTIVVLKAEYLKTLKAGEHTLSIVSDYNGNEAKASTTFTIVSASSSNTSNPKPGSSKPSSAKPGKPLATGDDTPITIWVVMLVLCAGTAAVILPRKKHN
ncbi:MAG: hypothetical protein ACI3W7_08355, partial [Oscillospiraceae bacterium]